MVVRRLLERSRFTTRSLLLTPAALASFADLDARLAGLPVYLMDQQAMNAVAGFDIHRGCLAAGERGPSPAWQAVIAEAHTVVVLERVANADNVGGIFRNAAALGADAVLLDQASTDPLYRKAIRTSMGAALHVPFAVMTDWPGDLGRLRAAGFTLVALTPAVGARTLTDVASQLGAQPGTGRRIALLLGHEGSGLSDEALAAAGMHARIPMATGVDSLNVATAAAIALYEIRGKGGGHRG